MRPPSKIHSECSSHEALPVKIFLLSHIPLALHRAALKASRCALAVSRVMHRESQAQHLSSRSSAFKPHFSKSPRSLATYIEVGCCPLPHCWSYSVRVLFLSTKPANRCLDFALRKRGFPWPRQILRD